MWRGWFHQETSQKKIYLRGKPSSNDIAQKVKRWNVKLHPPQIPLSVSWLGEAKTAKKAQKAAKAKPSQAMAAARFQKRHKGGGIKRPGARAVSKDTFNKWKGICKRQQGETCWTGGEIDNEFRSGINSELIMWRETEKQFNEWK